MLNLNLIISVSKFRCFKFNNKLQEEDENLKIIQKNQKDFYIYQEKNKLIKDFDIQIMIYMLFLLCKFENWLNYFLVCFFFMLNWLVLSWQDNFEWRTNFVITKPICSSLKFVFFVEWNKAEFFKEEFKKFKLR